MTPHKNQIVECSAPYFVKILKTHCDEKRCQSAAKMKRDVDRNGNGKRSGKKRRGENRGIVTQSGLDLMTSDPKNTPSYDEVFRLESKLKEAFPVKLLYTNRSKYGL